MKVVLLAGGFGTRISEETELKPKPMVTVGGRPILWHIMKMYNHFGFNEFVICLGYKGDVIKEYFYNYQMHMSDITIKTRSSEMIQHNNNAEDWTVTLVDTGESTMTGGRIKRVQDYVKDDEMFCLTYGDGVCDVNIAELVKFHKQHGKLATLTAVPPIERFGLLQMENENTVTKFMEKPQDKTTYINGGFFVLSPKIFDYIEGDQTSWEKTPLEQIAKKGELKAYKHHGFWQCMDTLRDRQLLESLWQQGKAPWKSWT